MQPPWLITPVLSYLEQGKSLFIKQIGPHMTVNVQRIEFVLPFGKPVVYRVGLLGIDEEDWRRLRGELQADRAFLSVSWLPRSGTLRLVVNGSLRLSDVPDIFDVLYDMVWTLTLPPPIPRCASTYA